MEDFIFARVLKCIRSSSLRFTRKRKQIIETLRTFEHPVSAADLRDKAQLPESDLVTVYRALEAFESIGIVQRVPLDTGGHLFELTAPDDHHHHFICRKCHKAERLNLCVGKELEKEARERGFSEVNHVMEVYGICSDCTVS
jgi:Fe2+ or Zn2+ uptake regulation protein